MNDLLGTIQNLAGTAGTAFIEKELGKTQTKLGTTGAAAPAPGGGLPKWVWPVAIGGGVIVVIVVVISMFRK